MYKFTQDCYNNCNDRQKALEKIQNHLIHHPRSNSDRSHFHCRPHDHCPTDLRIVQTYALPEFPNIETMVPQITTEKLTITDSSTTSDYPIHADNLQPEPSFLDRLKYALFLK